MEILGISMSTILGTLGGFAATVNIIVEVLKYCIPKNFPTQLLTIMVSLIVCLVFLLLFCEITIGSIVGTIFMSLVVAYTSMNGFDTVKNIFEKFQVINKGGDNSE